MPSSKSLHPAEVPVGALIIKDNRVIGQGFNQREGLNDPTAHAEILAITAASNTIGNWRLDNCDIYVTKEPCPMCAGAIISARIRGLFFLVHLMRKRAAVVPYISSVEIGA